MFLEMLYPKYFIFFQLLFGSVLILYKAPRRKMFALRACLSLVTGVGLSTAYAAFQYVYDNTAISIISYVYEMCLVCACLICCFDISIINAVFAVSGSYAIQHIGDIIVRFIPFKDLPTGVERAFMFGTPFVIEVAVWAVFLRRYPNAYNSGDIKHVFIAFLIILICIVLNSLRIAEKEQGKYYAIYDLIGCLCCLLIQFSVSRDEHSKQERKTLELIINKEHEQHEQSMKAALMLNVKFHDIKNRLDSLKKIVDDRGKEKDIEEIRRAVSVYSSMANTGNATLDALLMEKGLLCELNDIRFSYIADGKLLGFMAPVDIFSLFDNILDNAIESALNVTDKDRRIISLNVYRKKDMLFVGAENSCDKKLDLSDGLPATTKPDKQNHSYGKKGIMMVVEKYNGEFEIFQDKDNTVSVGMIFPLR